MSEKATPLIYRKEAIDHHTGVQEEGDVLYLSPAWTRWCYWVLLGAVATGLLFCIVGRVGVYATGTAIVRFEDKVELTSHWAGVVSSVSVTAGQHVKAGEALVTFSSAEESAALDRLQQEQELALVRYLRDPLDASTRQSFTALRTELELAEARLATRSLRAPRAGVVTDVRVQPGQYLSTGVSVLTIIPATATPSVVALLPGSWRPQLTVGSPLRMELDGFRHEYQDVFIDSVGDQIIGPTEARRLLGAELSDSFEVEGPIVLVRASLRDSGFFSDGRRFNYFDGMPARAEVRVRSESILLMLIPGLKELLPHAVSP
ncbi:efflux RND transporter periplasmic adaptor subunit [Corallococcus caeni]|uniref:CzcB-like barrel-sandwich hybrid domain-containing protein n=1 Tax=Corallococcus caeni TaxID=3082388 RepID=A0ABQ6QWD6_9BACT|nr:hypothetical protein ASNO1_42490 [Corallococcus sp. NO1]